MDSSFHWLGNIGDEMTFEKAGRKIKKDIKNEGGVIRSFFYFVKNPSKIICTDMNNHEQCH